MKFFQAQPLYFVRSNVKLVFNATGLQTKASAEFGNLVLDAGLNRMGKGSYFDAVALKTNFTFDLTKYKG